MEKDFLAQFGFSGKAYQCLSLMWAQGRTELIPKTFHLRFKGNRVLVFRELAFK